MQKRIIPLFILLALISCRTDITTFRISNLTGEGLDSLVVEPNARKKRKYISLPPRQSVSYPCELSHNKTDGMYFILYRKGNRSYRFPVDYFSNGTSLYREYSIDVLPDSVSIRIHR